MFQRLVFYCPRLVPAKFRRSYFDFLLPNAISFGCPRPIASSSVFRIQDSVLTAFGIPQTNSLEMLESYPALSKCSKKDIETIMDSFTSFQFDQEDLTKLIVQHPYLLCLDPSKVEKTFDFFIQNFKKSTVYKIFLNSPQVFDCSITDLEKKLEYLEKIMKVPIAEIASSGALGYSLDYIIQRHVFLSRVGVYRDINPKLSATEKRKINPRLSEIFGASDADFAKKISCVTLLEYEVFQQLFEDEKDDYLMRLDV